jgi:D-3-phosphoglycerate dehydrogenase
MAWRILITARGFKGTQEALDLLRQAGCELVPSSYGGVEGDHDLGGDELVALLDGVDAFIAGSAFITRDVLDRSPALKVIARRGVGFERIDVEAARDHNILVTITAGANQDAVADHAFALLLAAARRIIAGHRCVSEGGWEAQTGPELPGKTMGIIGLGRIGKGVARRARGFSMHVIATDPVRDDAFAREHDVTYVSLDRLLADADVVSVNASANETTYHLIDEKALARMKPSAILVNTARGEIVDETALASALRSGKIRAAGIDVFEKEPPGQTPLIGLPNVVLTAHTAAYSEEAGRRANLLAAEIVVNYLHGKLPREDCIVVAPSIRRPDAASSPEPAELIVGEGGAIGDGLPQAPKR